MADRAVVFIDGNNWYHSLKGARVAALDYAKISTKLAGLRIWVGTRYYIGQVSQVGNPQLYAEQRRFLSGLGQQDARISVHLGRIEERRVENDAAKELLEYLSQLPGRIDSRIYHELVALGTKHRKARVMVEKAVDVMLAVDLVVMAERNEYDTAYVLSADGDFTHAVQFVRGMGKRVFAVSASHGAQLAAAVNAFIHVDAAWFVDCYTAP